MSDAGGRLFSNQEGTTVSPLLPSGTGVYPSHALERLAQSSLIKSIRPIEADQFQPASLDLRLGRKAYRIEASFLPGPTRTVMACAEQSGFQEIDLTNGALLEKNRERELDLAKEKGGNTPEKQRGPSALRPNLEARALTSSSRLTGTLDSPTLVTADKEDPMKAAARRSLSDI